MEGTLNLTDFNLDHVMDINSKVLTLLQGWK